MKSIKILALIVGAIALFPGASFADNVSGKTQQTDLQSITIGNHNLSVTETQQRIIDAQKSGYSGTNVGGTEQKISGSTATVGSGNVDVKKAIQEALEGQTTK